MVFLEEAMTKTHVLSVLVVNPRPISTDVAQWPQVKLKFASRKKASSHRTEVSQVPPPSSCSFMRLKNRTKNSFLGKLIPPKERRPGNLTDIHVVGDEHRQHTIWHSGDLQEVPWVCMYLLKHAKLPTLSQMLLQCFKLEELLTGQPVFFQLLVHL